MAVGLTDNGLSSAAGAEGAKSDSPANPSPAGSRQPTPEELAVMDVWRSQRAAAREAERLAAVDRQSPRIASDWVAKHARAETRTPENVVINEQTTAEGEALYNAGLATLTDRQLDIWRMRHHVAAEGTTVCLGVGMAKAAIAELLGVGEDVVREHLRKAASRLSAFVAALSHEQRRAILAAYSAEPEIIDYPLGHTAQLRQHDHYDENEKTADDYGNARNRVALDSGFLKQPSPENRWLNECKSVLLRDALASKSVQIRREPNRSKLSSTPEDANPADDKLQSVGRRRRRRPAGGRYYGGYAIGDFVLSPEALIELTGKMLPHDQVLELDHMGIDYSQRRDGTLVVLHRDVLSSATVRESLERRQK